MNYEKLNLFINKFNDYELSQLPYQEAYKNDKRGFIIYYFSLIKKKQIMLFTFYTNDDYNLRSVKIFFFFSYLH